jgi:hypothetical protein
MMRLLHLSLLTNELTSDRTVWAWCICNKLVPPDRI